MNLDISRNWSAALSRLGFGSIFLYLMLSSELSSIDPTTFGADLSDLGNVFSALVQAFSFFAVVNVIGGSILGVGHSFLNLMNRSVGELWPNLSEERMLQRAQRVHELGNPFLASEFRDGRLQVSIAAGILGLMVCMFFSLLVLVPIYWSMDWLQTSTNAASTELQATLHEMSTAELTVVSGILTLVFTLSFLLASYKFQRIDGFLFEISPK